MPIDQLDGIFLFLSSFFLYDYVRNIFKSPVTWLMVSDMVALNASRLQSHVILGARPVPIRLCPLNTLNRIDIVIQFDTEKQAKKKITGRQTHSTDPNTLSHKNQWLINGRDFRTFIGIYRSHDPLTGKRAPQAAAYSRRVAKYGE